MRDNFDKCLEVLLKEEGGFVHNPHDPGGMTNLGVTKDTWESFVGHEVDEHTMRGLTPSMVAPLYKKRYWDGIKGDQLPSGVDLAVFDAAVNSGPTRAAEWLQRVIGVDVDGHIGPKTLAELNQHPVCDVIDAYCAYRLAFMHKLPTWNVFGKGWAGRVERIRTTSKRMGMVSA